VIVACGWLAWARRPVSLALLGLAAASLAGIGVYFRPQLFLRAARAALERGAYDEARASLARYLEARPQSAEAHLLLAQVPIQHYL